MGQRFQSARTNVLQGNSDGIFALRYFEAGLLRANILGCYE